MNKLDFEFTNIKLKNIIEQIFKLAKLSGATNTEVDITESIEKSISTHNFEVEQFETSHNQAVIISCYIGNKKGVVSSSTLDLHNIELLINKAISIAHTTEEDKYQTLPNSELSVNHFQIDDHQNLKLYNPIDIDNFKTIETLQTLERIARAEPLIKDVDSAHFFCGKYNFLMANTNGLYAGYQTTRFSIGTSLIAENELGMQTDGYYAARRAFEDLPDINIIAKKAINKTLQKLNKTSISSGVYNVILDPLVSQGIISQFIGALNGNSIYRNLSFLNDSIEQKVAPSWLNISENPFLIKGNSSCYFDNEGIKVKKQYIIQNGIVKTYLLNTYTANKLGIQTTGHAGGVHNLIVESNYDNSNNSLIQELKDGLLIIETIGHGLNSVTGDYSVGAGALVVKDSQIVGYVDNITLNGNLKDIIGNIKYIANDFEEYSSIQCGSILTTDMHIAV